MIEKDLKNVKKRQLVLYPYIGFIVPLKSNQACTRFYVNKHSEQKRDKKIFVVDYTPLNKFMKFIKHPIRNKDDLLKIMKGCHIFYKFDSH